MRARKAGVELSYCEAAIVTHHFDPGVAGLFRQFRRYGSFERQMCLKHPEYLNWLWASSEISCWPGLRAPGTGGPRWARGGPGMACANASARTKGHNAPPSYLLCPPAKLDI